MADTVIAARKALVRRLYDEVWNGGNFDIVDQFLTADFKFHGALGITAAGHRGFANYAETLRAAFPDCHSTIEDMVAEPSKLVACLTYRGTHKGPLLSFRPTGRVVEFAGMALFLFGDGLISHIWELGDRLDLFQQLSPNESDRPDECRTLM